MHVDDETDDRGQDAEELLDVAVDPWVEKVSAGALTVYRAAIIVVRSINRFV